MSNSKFVAKSFEQQHLQRVRKSAHSIIDINVALGDVHRSLAPKIDITQFEHATRYVDQFVSYTSVWNLKFVYNFESPEIAMLQLFHIQHVLAHFPEDQFTRERAIVQENLARFLVVTPFSDENIDGRYQKFLAAARGEEIE